MKVACIDFEGVLVPEIWISLADRTGIQALELTTRDIPDYDELMTHRLNIMSEHRLGYNEIEAAAAALDPLPGAVDFLNWLRIHFQVAIISDTFHELAKPLMAKLGHPVILCHRLEISSGGKIVGYVMRQDDPKRRAVAAFQSLNYKVVATGDSYNDTNMLAAADCGILFRAPDNVIAEFSEFPVTDTFDELKTEFQATHKQFQE